jgi:hypothetical protein
MALEGLEPAYQVREGLSPELQLLHLGPLLQGGLSPFVRVQRVRRYPTPDRHCLGRPGWLQYAPLHGASRGSRSADVAQW